VVVVGGAVVRLPLGVRVRLADCATVAQSQSCSFFLFFNLNSPEGVLDLVTNRQGAI